MNTRHSDIALILIDIQKGLDDWHYYGGNRNNPEAEKNASRILEVFRTSALPIFHVQHSSQNAKSPLHASKPGFQIKPEVGPLPDEPVYVKNVNSAFIGTSLQKDLEDAEIKKLVVVGLTTNHCISTSVRMGANLGFEIFLIADACAAFDQVGIDGSKQEAELVHQVSLGNLKDEFAKILDTEQLITEFL
ncbi:cysteine hydrolase family protein [Croceivirga thetidis]|uniref:Cysteine hydrolase n=1 Tax=Croceivirga thetidis TaxID=2721623 RepID=A0ABX1GUL2_9FLAO|nr:cysteine hydrolase family protein [Croceivirga thetidis]NKI32721.1 cysteine hydrolase [Croceivirga thetidis]